MDEFKSDMHKTDIIKATKAFQPKPKNVEFPKDEKIFIHELFSNKMGIFCGWSIIHYNRTRLEMFSISFDEKNEILITDSTKDGRDAMRIITDYVGEDIISIGFHRDDENKKILFTIEDINNGNNTLIDIPYWDHLYKTMYSCEEIVFLADPDNF